MLRIKKIRESKNLTQDELVSLTGISKRSFVSYENNQTDIPLSKLQNIATALNVSISELIEETKCEENVIKKNDDIFDDIFDDKPNVKKMSSFTKTTSKRPPLTAEKAQELQNIASGAFWAQKPKLIPVYGVSTIGGTSIGADMSPVSEPEGYIEAGGWFPSVTAAIYHYGDSMEEYPAGVLLALQEVYNRRNIIWGSNYVIETSEMRITKRLQTCPDDKNYIMAYSSNKETYPDGRLVHEPITIHKEDITRLFLVIGVIKKEQMSAPILIKPNRG